MQLYDVLTITQKITAATPVNRLVTYSGTDGQLSQATAGTQAPGGVLRRATTAALQSADVGKLGIFPVEYGEAVNQGDKLTSDASGKAVVAGADDQVWGSAEEDGGDGTIGSIFLGGANHVIPGA